MLAKKLLPVRSASGFTLLELLVVVAILAALVALALPYYQDYVNQSRITASQSELQTFQKALAAYDQLEPIMFNSANLLPLIGRYTQDFRKTAAQTMPTDPWGRDYVLSAAQGTVLSWGPDGVFTAGADSRLAYGDDIIITWKPPFYVTGARMVSPTTFDVYFSRKLTTIPVGGAGGVTCAGATMVAAAPRQISPSQFRYSTTAGLAVGSLVTVTNGSAVSQDGRNAFDNNPSTAALGNTWTLQ